jgi:hypothetical protein
MARTLIENPYLCPVTLPFPYRGILGPKCSAVVEDTAADVITAFGGVDMLGGLRLTDLPSDTTASTEHVDGEASLRATAARTTLPMVVQTPTAATHAATKKYVDDIADALWLAIGGLS